MTHGPDSPRSDLRLEDFDFDLPREQIAREPARPRDRSRLLVVRRSTREWEDSLFRRLAEHLGPGDLLVLNNTRVIPARVFGSLERNERVVELLFADPLDDRAWSVMVHPGRRVREGDRIRIGPSSEHPTPVYLRIGPYREHGLRTAVLESEGTIREILNRHGHVPLPPYLEREDRAEDHTDYQTVFARDAGAVAAPTAGLHFTAGVFESLAERRVESIELTLHVGIGTFLPVRAANPREHRLLPERFQISAPAAERLNRARAERRRVIAVGTTTARTLEYVLARHGRFIAGAGSTDLYILPGHRFKAIDGLLTNFHLPRSTLLLLVSAFASRELALDAYRHAVHAGYRFYSYGDASLFL